MDEQIKARLIGATVLVVIAVVLVPELLSGPRRSADDDAGTAAKRGTRTYTIDLSGGSAAGKAELLPTPAADSKDSAPRLPTVAPPGPVASVQEETTAAADAPAATAAPDVAPAKPVQAATQAAPAVAKPAASETGNASSTRDSSTAAAVRGGWAVQVGAFGAVATARKLVADLQRDGYPAYIAPLTRSGKTLHRVRVGPQPNRADADKLAARLKARGLPASVVAAD